MNINSEILKILAILGILVFFFLRPIAYRYCLKTVTVKTAVIFTGVWLVIGVLLLFPFCNQLLIVNGLPFYHYPIGIICAIAKGILLWFLIKEQQTLNKQSTSSTVFVMFIGMGLSSFILNVFFKEGLSIIQLSCILGIAVLGGLFAVIGHLTEVNNRGKLAFLNMALLSASCIVMDYLAVKDIGWYPYLLTNSLTYFIFSLIGGKANKEEWKAAIFRKRSIFAGVIFMLGEICLIASLVTILPVSIAVLVNRLVIPLVMIFSYFVYKEGKLKEQLLFGILAYLMALPLALL